MQDLKRTFPKHAMWTVEPGAENGESQGVQLLRNILRSYAYYDREVVYCQVGFVPALLSGRDHCSTSDESLSQYGSQYSLPCRQ